MPKCRALFNRSSWHFADKALAGAGKQDNPLSHIDISQIDPQRPVLIAGPTASGKSALALEIAETQGGVIINADASQVFDGWRVLTARPSLEDEARAPHALYGHVPFEQSYSAGQWLRDVTPYLSADSLRPIIVGGTGLYFSALTEGLADIPSVPLEVRSRANELRSAGKLDEMINALDDATRAKIDLNNPMRVQRAWEVQQSSGSGLAYWHAQTPPPLLPLSACSAFVLDAQVDWLNARISRRFELMLAQGALDEAKVNLERYDPDLLSCKAIGAPELTAYLRGETDLEGAKDAASTATRQFAKRQRTWFRARMKAWQKIPLP